MTTVDEITKVRKCFTIHLYYDGDLLLIPDENNTPLIESDISQVDAFCSQLRDTLVLAMETDEDWSED